jgi:predicted N-acetyltransferase YhbS
LDAAALWAHYGWHDQTAMTFQKRLMTWRSGQHAMDGNFTLRRYCDADAPAILVVIKGAFAEHAGKLSPPSSAEHKTVEIVRAELAVADALVAESEGRIVGCVFFRPQGSALYIDRLAVFPQHRGRGIATALVAEVERVARAMPCDYLILSVRLALTRQQALYGKMGFVPAGMGTHEGFSTPTFMKMRKQLNSAPRPAPRHPR